MGKENKSTVYDSFNLDEVLMKVKKKYDRQKQEEKEKKRSNYEYASDYIKS